MLMFKKLLSIFILLVLVSCNNYCDPFYGCYGGFNTFFSKETKSKTPIFLSANKTIKNPSQFPLFNGNWDISLDADSSTCTQLQDSANGTLYLRQTVSSRSSSLNLTHPLFKGISFRGTLKASLPKTPIYLKGSYRLPISGCKADMTGTITDLDQNQDLTVDSFSIKGTLQYACKKTGTSCSATYSGQGVKSTS